MGIAVKIVRADLIDYKPTSTRENLKKQLQKKQRSASYNNLSLTVELLYSIYKDSTCDRY